MNHLISLCACLAGIAMSTVNEGSSLGSGPANAKTFAANTDNGSGSSDNGYGKDGIGGGHGGFAKTSDLGADSHVIAAKTGSDDDLDGMSPGNVTVGAEANKTVS